MAQRRAAERARVERELAADPAARARGRRTDVTFHAAVDPDKYPVVAVTEEPGDGDPGPTRPDVLRSRAAG
ncbi:MAG: hypothetical protein ACR2LH_05440 [Thermoleophilaceae bacterium]